MTCVRVTPTHVISFFRNYDKGGSEGKLRETIMSILIFLVGNLLYSSLINNLSIFCYF